MWAIAGIFAIIFQCTPIRAVYDFTLATKSYCFPFSRFFFTYELLNAVLDVAILAIPAFVIRNLQLSTGQKRRVASIFFLGGL